LASSSSAAKIEVVALDDAEILLESWSWRFALDRREEIARHFTKLQSERPGVWNGRVLLLNRFAIRDRVLHGACFETNFASLCAWRDWMPSDSGAYNFFAAAALQAADGAYLVGEMASDTAAAGRIYFPCGTPEPDDIGAGGAFDLTGNLRRELLEETGIEVGELTAAQGWNLVQDRGFIGLLKRVTAQQTADELRRRILSNLAQQTRPEFTDIHIVRGPADLDPRMPLFVVAFLEHAWRQ
jgi:8-oxo-dGTP pyrophosphatase MutT (NUDIX family)